MRKPLHQTLKEWSASWERLMVRTIVFISPVVLPAVVYAAVRVQAETMALMHWALGLASALGSVIIAVSFMLLLRKEIFEKYPTRVVITIFGISVAAAISAFAAISYYLVHQEIAEYEIRCDYSIATFADYYVWTFVDMLPALDVWRTLGVPSPATPKNVAAGLPVLAFRLFVLLGIFASYKAWRKYRNEGQLN